MALKKGEEVEITIDTTAFKGKGIGRIDGLAVFVPNTAPGDRVKARIIKKKKKYREAKVLEYLEKGPNHTEPRCQHAYVCGGCTYQHIPYDYQLQIKREQVRDHYHRIGELTGIEPKPTIACKHTLYYRNKMEYSFGDRRWLTQQEVDSDEFVDDQAFTAGLHAPGRFDKILNLNECHLQDLISFQIMDYTRDFAQNNGITPYNTHEHSGYLRNLVIRTADHTDDLMVNLVTRTDDAATINKISDALLEQFPRITTIVNNINDKRNPTAVGRYENIIYGSGYITDYIGDYKYVLHANSFFQTNTSQAEKLYNKALEYANIQPDETAFDLYCGVGSISLAASSAARKVVGIEIEKVAVKNARTNVEQNNVDNVEIVQGDLKDTFNDDFISSYGKPDVLFTDPPRAGMHEDVVRQLCELKIPRIVYISCDSSTMARDIKKLNEVYEIEEVQPVDMFPQTYHIETVASLRLRQ